MWHYKRGVFLGEAKLVVFYYLSLLKSGLIIRGVASLEKGGGGNLIVFDYFRASEIWHDKKSGLSSGGQFSSIFTISIT